MELKDIENIEFSVGMGFTMWDCPPDKKFRLDSIDFETGECQCGASFYPIQNIMEFFYFDGSPITYRK